ncbi:MAG: DUF4037 domain-containing protein, partial [Oscillospiraceae bacterium]|nr:DUF4037 domain-containing protein [Oscillospiraceae bacterium]
DHDFDPGFCIFIPGEDKVSRKDAFRLERAYHDLPKEFMGLERPDQQPVGGARRGIIRTEDFLMEKTGTPDGCLTLSQWMTVPEQLLLEVTNGELFFDSLRQLTEARSRLAFFPEDVMKKKLAGQLLLMGQSGQYTYLRCIRHGEKAAAQLAAVEFVRSSASVLFLLNRRYQPYYKWCFRAMRSLPRLSILAELLEYLLTTDNEDGIYMDKYDVIESISADIAAELERQNLTSVSAAELERHAYSVNDGIGDPDLRNAHVLAAV